MARNIKRPRPKKRPTTNQPWRRPCVFNRNFSDFPKPKYEIDDPKIKDTMKRYVDLTAVDIVCFEIMPFLTNNIKICILIKS